MIVAMCVRDEAATLAQTLDSLRVALGRKPRFLFHDTGSTDGTPAIAVRYGVVLHREWPDSYADAYNAVLADAEARAQSSEEWIFHAYARRTYHGRFARQPYECAWTTENWSEWLNASRITAYRARLGLRYEGRTHEVLRGFEGRSVGDSGVTLRRLDVAHPRPERFERDLRLLEGDDSPRAAFYRAQTLACLGRLPEAYDAYLARAHRTDGDQQERYVALFRVLQMYPREPAHAPVIQTLAGLAGTIAPERVEHHVAAAEWYADVGLLGPAAQRALRVRGPSPAGGLFVDPTAPARAAKVLARATV